MARLRVCIAVLLATSLVESLAHADEFDVLKAEFEAAQQKFWDAKEGEKTTDPTATFVARMRELAEKQAGSPAELKSLSFILQNARRHSNPSSEPDARWAVKRLSDQYAPDPALGEVLRDLWFGVLAVGRQPMIDLYERVIRENKDRAVIAQARLSLATTLRRVNAHGSLESKPSDRPADVQRSTELFREIVARHDGTEAAKRAARYLFEIERLQVGMEAPDIVGKDVNGKEIRLSQFRGKIVYLDFWGFW
jgi:hypothetical protein